MTDQQKVLIIITSHDTMTDGKKTGYWLGEVTHFYHIIAEAGMAIDFASLAGSEVPVDEKSYNLRDKDNRRFLEDQHLKQKLERTIPIDQINPEDYVAIYFAGGHGAMWDFPSNEKLSQVAAKIYESGGFVAAVCHGSAGLLNIQTSTGQPLIAGKTVTGFANLEERLIRLTHAVPFLLEDELKNKGASYKSSFLPFMPHVQVSERIITGQNPQSARAVAKALINALRQANALKA